VARLTSTAEAGDDRWRGVLAGRAARRAALLLDAIETAGLLYAAERLHAVRIAAKRLRYVLEVAAETRAVSCARAVAELKRMQDALGQLHDLQVLAHYASVARLRSGPAGAEATALAELIGRIEDECRQLHAGFLGRRAHLVAAAADTRDRIVPRLHGVGVRATRRGRRHE
jgi:CHAD domain-containing protein